VSVGNSERLQDEIFAIQQVAPARFVWALWTALLVLALALPAVAIGGSSWIYGSAKRTQNVS
jgi:hypothetical protein